MTSFAPDHPHLDALAGAVVARWPDHAAFVAKSIAGRDPGTLAVSERLSQIIARLGDDVAGGMDTLCDDYRFLCEEIVLPEEIHFRREGGYRLSAFADAERESYANGPFMERYMNGLLLSDVLWVNHARAFGAFVRDYLPRVREAADHLEIGPGHGIFLYFAAQSERVGSVTGWDVSATSIAKTRHALERLGARLPVELREQNLFDAGGAPAGGAFDSIVMSEILEHLEDPVAALRAASAWLRPGGLLWINVPANSPAPDHIYLFEDVEHACRVAQEAGLEVLDSQAFPMVGATLERARKHRLAVSCVVTTRKPG